MSWPVSPKPESVYVPNEKDKRKFGLDQSRYQGPMNFEKLKNYIYPKVDFIVARSGISWGYKDAWFREFWKQYKILGIPRGAYHVLYPKESITEQVRNCSEQFDGKVFDGEVIVNDVELDHGASRKQISEAVYECNNRLQDWAKVPVLTYCRFSFITGFMDYTTAKYVDFFQEQLWWLAQYYSFPQEDIRPVYKPVQLENIDFKVLIHQTGDKMYGPLVGAASQQQDTNRWLGTDAEFEWMWGKQISQPEPQPINITAELAAIRAAATSIEQKVNSL